MIIIKFVTSSNSKFRNKKISSISRGGIKIPVFTTGIFRERYFLANGTFLSVFASTLDMVAQFDEEPINPCIMTNGGRSS